MDNGAMRGIIISVLALLLVASASCSRRPDGILSEARMAEVLAELGIAEQITFRQSDNDFSSDSSRRVMRQAIFAKYEITPAQFDSTLGWYGHHIDDYARLYAKVDARIERRQRQLAARGGKESVGNDLWPLSPTISIGEHDAMQGFSFEVPGHLVSPGNKLVWHMRLNRMQGNGGTLLLAAEYTDQEMVYVRRPLYEDGSGDVELMLADGRRPERIAGYVMLRRPVSGRVWIDSLQLLATPMGPSDRADFDRQPHLPPTPDF